MSFGDKNFTYGPRIVKDGLVFYVDAANPKSYVSGDTTTNDLISNITGTLENGTGFSGENNGSWSFDGTNDYIDCGNIIEIKNNSEVTISFWAKIEDTSFRILFGQNLVSGNDIFQLYYWGADTLYIWIKNGGTGTVSYVDTSGIINIGEWYHFMMVFNGSLSNDDRCKLFLNGGSDIITNRGTMPTAFTNSDEPFLIGRGLNGYYQGNISNVKIYNRSLSQTEITQNYNALKPRFGL